jgi:ferritin-like metal-binding protein YciE
MRMFFAERGCGEPISLGASLLAGKKVGPDITQMLAEDHRTVMGWFDWYEAEGDPARRAMVQANILDALWAHMAAEEEIFYPQAAAKTGDERLVPRAIAEHEVAKKLMRAIARGEVDAPAAMASLRAEIARHIVEEEGQLFPLVRECGLDLYEVGRFAAARRVERLLDLTGRNPDHLKETAAMPISKDEARDFFILGLRNIHATVHQGRTMVQAQLNRLENYPKLYAKLESHRVEKDMQLARVEKILEGLGESPSSFKDTTMSMMGSVSSATTAMAGDEILKNSFSTYGLANFEAAAYETLILLAEVAEQYDALEPLQLSLGEERGMAAFIAENLRGTGLRFLELRTEGRQASH